MCLINDYLLIADLRMFVYGSAECATHFTWMYKGETSYYQITLAGVGKIVYKEP